MVFASINILLLIINVISRPHTLWFFWITLFWGVGICGHAFSVFGYDHLFSMERKEKIVKGLLEKDERK